MRETSVRHMEWRDILCATQKCADPGIADEFITRSLNFSAHNSPSSDFENEAQLLAELGISGQGTALGRIKPKHPVPAAVLVPLVWRETGINVVLTQRTDHLQNHAGQISFPGGRVEEGDRDGVHTALRETTEEIGIAPSQVCVLGTMGQYYTGTNYSITPVVGRIKPPLNYIAQPDEVAEIFEVPLAFVLDPDNHAKKSSRIRGVPRAYYVIEYQNRYIWGITAAILVSLYKIFAATDTKVLNIGE